MQHVDQLGGFGLELRTVGEFLGLWTHEGVGLDGELGGDVLTEDYRDVVKGALVLHLLLDVAEHELY